MASDTNGTRVKSSNGSKDRFWNPRFWNGMGPGAWFSLLARNRFAVSPIKIPMALINTAVGPANFGFGLLQKLVYGRQIERTQIADDPIFIIGHWRSGTTLLHELLVLDERFTYPDTYDCFAPGHFLASGWIVRPTVGVLLPKRRPIDNMAAGWDRPQEDEFALCNLGARSPYSTVAFPNRPPQDQEYFALRDLAPEALDRWKQSLHYFLKCLTVRRAKRIVLKSPPHTFRVRTLLEMYPRAQFVHIVRDPYVVYPSTVNLWKRLYRDQGFQVPRYEGLSEHIVETFCQMYETFERDRPLLSPEQLCEVRYEDLIENPVEQIRSVYETLALGEFDRATPALQDYFASHKDYKTNRYEISPQVRAMIRRRWGPHMQHYGYAMETAEV